MDLDGFREAQSPFFFSQPPTWLIENTVKRKEIPRKTIEPAPDNRYPGWAAPMSDGRLTTDYRPKCSLNFPTGTQFASRRFMQANAESIMNRSRQRQAELAGAGMSFDSRTVVPGSSIISCDSEMCSYYPYVENGIGVERQEQVPELFGTFAASKASIQRPAEPLITTRYEGGRNSIRGQVGRELIG